MKEPVWLTRQVVLAVQEKLLVRFGGLAGIRDEGLLDSAINRPLQSFHYGTNPSLQRQGVKRQGVTSRHYTNLLPG